MTEEEGNLYITLATLHGPTTNDGESGSHDPLQVAPSGVWWVFRDDITIGGDMLCAPNFVTRAEAARHYCLHYGLIKP